MIKKIVAEFIGTFALVLIGCGAVVLAGFGIVGQEAIAVGLTHALEPDEVRGPYQDDGAVVASAYERVGVRRHGARVAQAGVGEPGHRHHPFLSRSAPEGTSLAGPANESLTAARPFTCPLPLPMLASVQPLRAEGGSP